MKKNHKKIKIQNLIPKKSTHFKLRIIEDDSSLCTLSLCFLTEGFNNKDRNCLSLVDNILSGGLSSRLSLNLREE